MHHFNIGRSQIIQTLESNRLIPNSKHQQKQPTNGRAPGNNVDAGKADQILQQTGEE